jgi:hypothetical protein
MSRTNLDFIFMSIVVFDVVPGAPSTFRVPASNGSRANFRLSRHFNFSTSNFTFTSQPTTTLFAYHLGTQRSPKMAIFDDDEDIVLFTDDWTPVRLKDMTPPDEMSDESAGDIVEDFSDAQSLSSFTWEELASQKGDLSEPNYPSPDDEDLFSDIFGCEDLTTYPEIGKSAVISAVTTNHALQPTNGLHLRKAIQRMVPAPASIVNPLYQSRYASQTNVAPIATTSPMHLMIQPRYPGMNPDPVLTALPSQVIPAEPVSPLTFPTIPQGDTMVGSSPRRSTRSSSNGVAVSAS